MKKIHTFHEWLESRLGTALSALFLCVALIGLSLGKDNLIAFAWGSVLLSGTPIILSACSKLRKGKISSPLLVSMAMFASLMIGEVFAAAEIAFIMALGELLEHATVSRARRGLQHLLSLNPEQGRKLRADGREQLIKASEIAKGDLLRVKPGETIPADGRVAAGCSAVNQAILTGESLPVECSVGSQVFAGTLNGEGSLDILVDKEPDDTTLKRLIALVKEAEEHRAPVAGEADRWASRLVPAALLVAMAGFGLLLLMGYPMEEARMRAVTVLVVFCPCALVLATPTAMAASIGQATRKGVIIKSGAALERLARVTCVCFDKTGTLTRGRLSLQEALSFGIEQERLLRLAAAVESHSEHPLAQAVVNAYGSPSLPEASGFRALPGRGAEAQVEGQRILCAGETGLADAGIHPTSQQRDELERLRRQGCATILVARGQECIGLLALADTIRPETQQVLASLSGLLRILLTGDHPAATERLTQQAELDELHCGLLPHEKVELLQKLRLSAHVVAMVGDGINDAPALRCADVGIAVSRPGNKIATEAADIALMNNELTRLPYLFRLAHATLNTIRFNIAASLIINLAAVTLSLLGMLSPISGALVHNAGSLLVILNAALLYDRSFDRKTRRPPQGGRPNN